MDPERRRAARHPIELRIEFGRGEGVTRDVSGLGVLFHSHAPFESGEQVDFSMTIDEGVVVRCRGSVRRVRPAAAGGYDVAATIERYALANGRPPDDLREHIVIRELALHHPEGWEWGE